MNNNNCDAQIITEYYEEYSREYQNTIINLEKFNSKTKDLIIDTYRNITDRNHHAGTLTKIKSYILLLQKLNQEIAAADQPQNVTVTSSIPLETHVAICDDMEKIAIEQNKPTTPLPESVVADIVQNEAKITQNTLIDHEHPCKHFNYPHPEIHLYSKGQEGICVISYVRKCEYKKSFFILDKSMIKGNYTEALSKLANLSFELKVHKNWIPGVDDVFGVFVDNCLFRAVKQTKAEPTDRNFKIFLIDIGDIFDIDIGTKDIYDLPKDVRVMPAQGLYCVLDRKAKITIQNIKDGLYKERSFKITKIKKSTFHLDEVKEITNPFFSQLVIEKINASKTEVSTANSTTNHRPEYTSSSDDLTLSGSDISKNATKSKASISEIPEMEQPSFLENRSTSNAIEAVMTFRPTDDMRICHFYDPRTKACFKGPNCKLQHLPQVDGGWSRDKLETKVAIAAQLEYPECNSCITIIPTSIDLDGSFWAQIEFGSRADSFVKLKQLNLELNSSEYVVNYKELDHFPVYSELVLAQYSDGLWYRARIIGDYDQRFKVFFLDYGNCGFITLNKIRKWDSRCDHLPFQAILCHIANITVKQDNHKRKLDVLENLILNKRLTAIVINNLSDLDVLLMDSTGADIGDQLVQMNLASHRKMITPMHGANCNPLPQ